MFLKRRYDIWVHLHGDFHHLGEHIFDRDLSDRDVCWFAIPLSQTYTWYEEIK